MDPSSNGSGYRPLKAKMRVQVPQDLLYRDSVTVTREALTLQTKVRHLLPMLKAP